MIGFLDYDQQQKENEEMMITYLLTMISIIAC